MDATAATSAVSSEAGFAAGSNALGDFIDKISGADSLVALMSASLEDQTLASVGERQLVGYRRLQSRHHHQRRMEAMKKYWEAMSHRSFWSKLGFLGKILGALSAALAPFSGGASLLVGAAATAVGGTGNIGEKVIDRRMASAQVAKMMAKQNLEETKTKLSASLDTLAAAADYEKNMVNRLQKLIDSRVLPALR